MLKLLKEDTESCQNKKQVMAGQDVMISRAACENAKLDMHITYTHITRMLFQQLNFVLMHFTRASTMTVTYDIIAHVCAFNCSHNISQIHAVENRS